MEVCHMRYKRVYSRLQHNTKHKSNVMLPWIAGSIVTLAVLDGLAVGVLQAIPATAVSLTGLINFQSNALGNRPKQKIYTHVDLSKLSDLQKKSVSFTDNNYINSLNSITDYLGDTSKLYLQGYVAVPNVGISEPIYYGTSNASLANGAGTAKDNQVMGQGNYGISAHNMGPYVNWKVPVPSVSGGYINPGKYFSSLQNQTPTYIYTTDGKDIYTYKEANRQITNVGNGNVLSDDYPYDSKDYTYPLRNSEASLTGTEDTDTGLGLGSSNNTNKSVGEYKFSSLVNNENKDTTYVIKYKTSYPYAGKLSSKNFKIDVETSGIKISGLTSKIVDVKYENGEIAVSFKLSGDVSEAASTIGSKLVLKQLQDKSFVTLTTCVVPANGGVSANRIVNTGELIKVTEFTKAPKRLQKLFPALLKSDAETVSANNGVASIGTAKLTWWQKIVSMIGKSLLWQSNWLSKHF